MRKQLQRGRSTCPEVHSRDENRAFTIARLTPARSAASKRGKTGMSIPEHHGPGAVQSCGFFPCLQLSLNADHSPQTFKPNSDHFLLSLAASLGCLSTSDGPLTTPHLCKQPFTKHLLSLEHCLPTGSHGQAEYMGYCWDSN